MTSWSSFLSTVLPEEGYYCIASYKKGTKPLTDFADTVEGTQVLIQKLLDKKRDVYFGCAKFNDNESREASNAGWVKAYWLDLDCGVEKFEKKKGYLTQQDALLDLQRFSQALGLPKPHLVNSGNGIHAYWVLNEAIGADEWKLTAELWKRQLIKHGVIVDHSRTTDLASVLRVPDTFNFKVEPPIDVKWLTEGKPVQPISYFAFKMLVSKDLNVGELDLTKAPRRPMDETTRALMGNYMSNFAEIMKGGKCAQLTYAYKNQDTIGYDLWRGALSVAQRCEDRDTAIHKLSEKHPNYSWADTEGKANDTGGPQFCTTFESNNPGGCDGCPSKGTISSPIQLSRYVAKASEEDNVVTLPSFELGGEITYTIPQLPFPYFRGKNGGIYRQGFTKDEGDGDETVVEKDKLIYKHDFYVVKRMLDPELGEMIWMRLHLPNDGVREFACAATELMAFDTFKSVVSKRGVIGTSNEMKAIMNYVTAFAQELLDRNAAEQMRVQFGWCDDDSKFIVGDKEISIDGSNYSPPSSTTMPFVHLFKPKGTLEQHKRVTDVYARPGQEARAFLFFAGLGAPLLKFTKQKGLIYSITENESGTGKTTIQKVINSIWGQPEDLMLIKDDTIKSQFHQMGVFNNLPICVDEVTDMTNEAVSKIAYGVSQGRSNNRMEASSNKMRLNNSRWSLPAFMSGNSSMHDKIAALKATPESEQLRIVEIEISQDKELSKEFTDEIFNNVLLENYGHVGSAMMSYIVPNLPEVKELLKKTQLQFDNEAQLQQKQRFYSAGAASAFTAAIIAKRLGLHNIPMDTVWDWAVKYFSDLRESVKPATRDPLGALGAFLNAHNRNLLVVDNISDKRTGLSHAPIVEPYGQLMTRFEPDTNLVYIAVQPLREWCTKMQISYTGLLNGLKKLEAGGTIIKKAMAKGSPLNTPPVNAVQILNSKLRLMDDMTPQDADS